MKLIQFFIVTFALMVGQSAFAAMPPMGPMPELLQRQQQQQMDDEFRQQRIQDMERRSPFRTGVVQTDEREDAAARPSGNCVQINQVIFDGNTKISDRAIRRIIGRYQNRCLFIEEINTLLNDITNLYLERGYATSRAYMEMPQTRLRDGILEIRIVEGIIGRIEGLPTGEHVTAFPNLHGKVLNIRDIEQGLDQINRLGSNRASMDVRAVPDVEATSVIDIKNERGGRTQMAATMDNYGMDMTGQWRAGLRVTQDNLLGLNDQVNVMLNHTADGNFDHRNARSAMVGVSVPFGYWTLNNTFAYSDFVTSFAMPISGDRFYTEGNAVTNTISLDRIIARGRTYKLSATGGLTYRDNENFMRVYDLVLRNDMSSRALTVINFDLPLTLYFPRGMLFARPSVHRGLNMFGAHNDRDPNNAIYTQQAQYTALKFFASAQTQFKYFTLSATFDSQYSRDELFATEGFFLGGESSVRGFRNDGTMGDSGFSIRNDITLNLAQIFKSNNVWLRRFSPGVFADYGMIFPNSPWRENGTMAGAGARLGFRYWMIDASASYAQVLAKEDWMTENYNLYFFAGLTGRF